MAIIGGAGFTPLVLILITYEAGRLGGHSGSGDASFILWLFAGPLLIAMVMGSVISIGIIPVSFFQTKKPFRERLSQACTGAVAAVALFGVWVLLGFISNYTEWDLMWSLLATGALIFSAIFVFVLGTAAIIELFEKLRNPKK
jgi:hypothetical protein